MVQPTSSSAAQQNYLSPLPNKNDNATPQRIDKPEAEKYQTGVSDKPPVEDVEQAAKQEIDKTNIKLASQGPLEVGSRDNETTERGSLVDVLA